MSDLTRTSRSGLALDRSGRGLRPARADIRTDRVTVAAMKLPKRVAPLVSVR